LTNGAVPALPDEHAQAPASESKEPEQSGPPLAQTAITQSPASLNLRQKLAQVRQRIGYIQKRGVNERFNYSYVTAADIAGIIGDALSELGVVVLPSLDSIAQDKQSTPRGTEQITRVVMSYTFLDSESSERLTVKVPGEGRDPGDKAPYKAMTGALKYALLQSFLIATGDDPEDEVGESGQEGTDGSGGERCINAQEKTELCSLIEQSGTELERVLEYYKIETLEEMTETVYRRALETLRKKLAKQGRPAAECSNAQA